MTITEFRIGGADRRSIVILDSLRITLGGDGRGSSCEFAVRAADMGQATVGLAIVGQFLIGDGLELLQPVRVSSGSNVIFGGEVAIVRSVYERGVLMYRVVARDWQSLLDNVVTGLAVYVDAYDGDILRDLISRFAPGVTVARADKIVRLTRIDLSNKQLTEAIRTLANLAGAEWNLDGDKKLYYFDPDTVTPNFSLSDAPDNINTFPINIDGELELDATELVNDVTVANQASVTTTTVQFTPAASADDGWVRRDGTTWPPSGAFTTDTTATTIRAERTRVNTVTNSGTFFVSGGPWSLRRVGIRQWPPPPPATQGTSSTCEQSIDGTPGGEIVIVNYTETLVYFNIDTTTIPSNAVIKSATLRFNASVTWDGVDRIFLGVEQVPPGQPTDANWLMPGGRWLLSDLGSGGLITTEFVAVPGAMTGVVFGLSGFPEGGANRVDISNVQLDVTYDTPGTSYVSRVGLARWDTSSIPDGAQVLSGTVRLTVSSVDKTVADSATVLLEPYGASEWPIDSGDWTATAAGQSIALSNITAGQTLTFTVPPESVSKTGYTGIRIHVDTRGQAPSGANAIEVSSTDAATNKPRLDVEYADLSGYFSARATDATSIAQFGTRALTVIDSRIRSQSEAQARADVLIARRARPVARIRARWTRDGAARGGTVFVSLGRFGFDSPMIVRSLSLSWLSSSVTQYEADLGEYRRDLVALLRKLALLESK